MKWTKQQDMVAYYLYRSRDSKNNKERDEMGEKIGIVPKTLRMRMKNFQFLDGRGGLNKPAQMSKETFAAHQHLSLEELGNVVSKFFQETGK